ncbi:MipA/OmpV family protein, partial [Salmonella enterica subsp. enterica serovar Typhimurium]
MCKIVGLTGIGGYTFAAEHLNKELWIVTKLKLL